MRPTMSWASLRLANTSSANTASSVWIKQTRRCSFTGIRALSIGGLAKPQAESPGLAHCRDQVAAVGNLVAVTLLGQKELAMVGEIQLARIARHEGKKVGQVAVGLGPK